jgi:hypothetical protein
MESEVDVVTCQPARRTQRPDPNQAEGNDTARRVLGHQVGTKGVHGGAFAAYPSKHRCHLSLQPEVCLGKVANAAKELEGGRRELRRLIARANEAQLRRREEQAHAHPGLPRPVHWTQVSGVGGGVRLLLCYFFFRPEQFLGGR